MPYPASFYFLDKQEGDIYSHKPQGTFVVNRLIHHQAPWRVHAKHLKPKSLVLVDWTANQWSEKKIKAIKELIRQLIDDGFDVYVSKKNTTIEALTKETLDSLNDEVTRRRLADPPESYEAVKQRAIAQHKLTDDRVHIIDDYGLKQLLSDQMHPEERQLSLIEFSQLYSGITPKIISLIKYSNPKIEAFIHDEFSQNANKNLLKLREKFPDIPIKNQFEHLILDEQSVHSLLGEQEELAFSIDGPIFKRSELQKIKGLRLTGNNTDVASLDKILSESPELKALILESCVNLVDGTIKENVLDLSKLELLQIQFCALSSANLQSLLSNASNLKTLLLTANSDLFSNFSMSTINFPYLEELEISGCRISYSRKKEEGSYSNLKHQGMNLINTDREPIKKLFGREKIQEKPSNLSFSTLQSLVAKSPNLKKLTISECSDITDKSAYDLSLDHLEELRISNSEISFSQLQSLLLKAPRIKKIEISNCKNLTGQTPANLVLEDLETLTINNSEISVSNLQCLLANTSRLRNIVIRSSFNLADEATKDFNLDNLESFEINRCNITIANLQHLVAKSPRLEKLVITSCHNLTEPFTENFNLEGLKGCVISDCVISAANLMRLLAKASQLKKLSLESCDGLTDESTENISVESLEELNISCDISAANFQHLLANAPGLKKLSITYSKQLAHFSTDGIDLENLEELIISHSDITATDLQNLLTKAPNLKKLHITRCHNLTDLTTDDITLGCLEEFKINSINISASNLQRLLARTTSNLKRFTIDNCELTEEIDGALNIVGLTQLNLNSSSITPNNLQKLLAGATSLKELEISGEESLTDELLEDCHLDSLEELDCSQSNITSSSLQHLISHASSLKQLSLNSCQKIEDNLTETPNQINLEQLYLSYSSINAQSVSTLLQATPNLKQLNIKGCKNLLTREVIDDLTNFNLTKLESLDARDSTITLTSLQLILANARNLRELYLSGCKYVFNDLTTNLPLESLETLDLSNSTISAESLGTLVGSAANLKSLVISNCVELYYNRNFRALSEQPVPNLSKLEKLDASESLLTDQDLQYIVTKAPNLQTLLLANCPYIYEKFTLNFELDSLQTLVLSASTISDYNLTSLLKAAPNLKQLNIQYCEYIFTEQALDSLASLQLTNLESLDADHSKISITTLQLILENAANLKTINLANCPYLYLDTYFTTNLNLESLEVLNLNYSKISAQNLKTLLRAAPNLKKLHIAGFNPYDIDPTLKALMKGIKVSGLGSQYLSEEAQAHHEQEELSTPSSQPQGHYSNSSKTLDADTSLDPDSEFHPICHFYPLDPKKDKAPAVQEYRLSVFNDLLINSSPCTLGNAFTLTNKDPIDFVQRPIEQSNNLAEVAKKRKNADKSSAYFWGSQSLTLTQEWQALVSFNPNEEITDYQNLGIAVEFMYSERDNLYYVRSIDEGSHQVNLNFLVKINRDEPSPEIPKEIDDLVALYHAEFKPGALNLDEIDNPTGYDYLKCIREQTRGACRHRSAAFKEEIKQKYAAFKEEIKQKYPVRCIWNIPHAFVEIYVDGKWVKRDLGGYPARLDINVANKPSFLTGGPTKSSIMINAGQQVDRSKRKQAIYSKQLETWTRSKSSSYPVSTYCQLLTQKSKVKKHLVELSSSTDVQALQLNLQAYCQSTSRPYFYINSPDDLASLASYIKRQGDRGVVTKGPGGPFYDFLQTSYDKKNPPVLIVNYDKFDTDDIIKFNELFYAQGEAGDTALPPKTIVVGLININKPNCYQGEDFYSHFNVIETCPLTSEKIAEHLEKVAPLPLSSEKAPSKTYPINLYNDPDWKERLLGHWVIQKDGLYFDKGELSLALESGLPIELQNAPWEDNNFLLFWRQALLRKGIEYEGLHLAIPKSLQLFRSEGYQWKSLTKQVTVDTAISAESLALNPGSFNDFFNRYLCDNDAETLDTQIGFIEEHASKRLDVNLTRDLSLDEWALFLTTCQKHKVKLNIHCAPSVTLPEEFGLKLSEEKSKPLPTQNHTKIIISTDSDTTLSQLTAKDENWKIIDISECQGDDLLLHTHVDFLDETGQMRFQQSKAVLLEALEQNEKVVLKGRFTAELVDSLAPLLLQRQNDQDVKGQIVLLSEQESFPFLTAETQTVSIEDKKASLEKNYSQEEIQALDDTLVNKESLSRLRARLNYLRINPQQPSENAWKGIYSLPGGVSLPPFDAKNSEKLAKAFEQQRLDAVNKAFEHSPYVCVTGLTGTGKTTFVDKILRSEDTVIYTGEDKIPEWAKDTSDKRKVLVIDEANSSIRQWSEFANLVSKYLASKHHGVRSKNKFYPLSQISLPNDSFRGSSPSNHYLMLLLNPLSYGDERKLSPFIEQNGSAIVFEPMPQEYIYEYILKPIFEKNPLQDHAIEICQPILEVYSFLCQCSDKEVLISARELQMMALFVVSQSQQQPDVDKAILAAKQYAYQLATNLVPEKNRGELDRKFKPPVEQKTSSEPEQQELAKGFLLTKSRQPVKQLLDNLLKLREFRQSSFASNDGQRYGGLGGLIVEGPPGIGKNALITASLKARGFEEIDDKSDEPLPDKGFYRIPANMPIEDQKQLILKAFHGGHGVIKRNPNSSPMMERFLNNLLMGKTPDGKPPQKPGFFLIGTQNPVTMAGRRAPSNALARRLITITLPEYPHQEIIDTLILKGIKPSTAETLTNAFEKNVKKAKQEHLSPAPTFRNLLHLAKQIVKAKNRKALGEGKEKEKEKESKQEKRKGDDDLQLHSKSKLEHFINKLRDYLSEQKCFENSSSFFSPANQAEISASEKLLNFLEKEIEFGEFSSTEVEALNRGFLFSLMNVLAENDLLERLNLQFSDEGKIIIQESSYLKHG